MNWLKLMKGAAYFSDSRIAPRAYLFVFSLFSLTDPVSAKIAVKLEVANLSGREHSVVNSMHDDVKQVVRALRQ